MKKNIWLIITLAIISVTVMVLFSTSCSNEYFWADSSDCDSCFTVEPEYGEFMVKLSDKSLANGVVIKIFKGKFTESMQYDDSKFEWRDTVFVTPYYVDVKLGEYYSVVAEYMVDSIKYSVIDGDKIKASSIKSTCDFDCWIVRGGEADCRLKY